MILRLLHFLGCALLRSSLLRLGLGLGLCLRLRLVRSSRIARGLPQKEHSQHLQRDRFAISTFHASPIPH